MITREYNIVEMCGRPVIIANFNEKYPNYDKDKLCSDCNANALFTVFEITNPYAGEQWGWCGLCEIGG